MTSLKKIYMWLFHLVLPVAYKVSDMRAEESGLNFNL